MASLSIDDQITFIYTTDLDNSARFYEGHMGLPVVLDRGGCRIYRVTRDGYLGVCERPAEAIQVPDAGKRSVIFTLVTQEVDAWYERLRGRGVQFENPPRHSEEYGIYHTFLRDPNGYRIEIQRFDAPGWNQG